jgi:hypothetical protein
MYRIKNRVAKYLQDLANEHTRQGKGVCLMAVTTKVETTAERTAFRDYVFRHAARAGVRTRMLNDVRKWLVKEFGEGFESTARRIIDASVKPTSGTVDQMAEKWGERFEFRSNNTPAASPSIHVADTKAKQATVLTKLAPIAKNAKREDLARLANEAASDPADVKLVAMMLLMFRDA